MEAYTAFADIYNKFMDNIPYEDWTAYIVMLLAEYGVENGIVLDLGCGTGNITKRLARQGYDMIGLDNSEEMLNIANEKHGVYEKDILYLNQDMREFELFGTVAAVVSVCDTMNYVTEYDELVEVFRLVNNYLDPRGVMIFDLKTYTYFQKLGDLVFAENKEDISLIWENTFYEDECINEYELTIFKKEKQNQISAGAESKYVKYSEFHYQRAYQIEEVKRALEEAGMEFVALYDAFTKNKATDNCDRVYIIAREHGK